VKEEHELRIEWPVPFPLVPQQVEQSDYAPFNCVKGDSVLLEHLYGLIVIALPDAFREVQKPFFDLRVNFHLPDCIA
jgi:hypothetical protein